MNKRLIKMVTIQCKHRQMWSDESACHPLTKALPVSISAKVVKFPGQGVRHADNKAKRHVH